MSDDGDSRTLMRASGCEPPENAADFSTVLPLQTATITCPLCGHKAVEPIPVSTCLYFYVCSGCRAVLKPKHGDCCVFCSYADRCCPDR